MSIIKDFIVKAGLQIDGARFAVSSSTAALQIPYGGIGVGGNIIVAGTGTFGSVGPGEGSTSSIILQTLQVKDGGLGVNGDSYFGDKLLVAGQTFISDTTGSSNTSSGALVVHGGVAVGENIFAGGNIYANADGLVITTATIKDYAVSTLTAGTDTVVNSSTGDVTVWNVSTLQTITDRGATTDNAISITDSTQSTTTGSGALQVAGSVGIWSSLNVGGTINATSNLSVASTAGFYNTTDASSIDSASVVMAGGLAVAKTIHSLNLAVDGPNESTVAVSSNALSVTSGGLGVNGSALIKGPTVLTTTTNSSNTNSNQALLVTGGVGIGGTVAAAKVRTVDQTAAETNGNASVQIAGGAYIGDNLIVMSSASDETNTASNALYVVGSVGVGKDLYVTGKIVAQQLTIEYTTVTTTVVETDDIITTKNNTQAINTNSGALQIPYGGAGIGRDLWVGESAHIGGDLSVLGNLSFGSGTTASGSFAKFFGDVWGSNAIYGGIQDFTELPNVVLQLTANTSTYAQANFQNINSGPESSADFVITADNGNDGSHFLDLGMASSNYSYPGYEIIPANAGYLNVMDGDLIFYTASVGHDIKFYTGGSAQGAGIGVGGLTEAHAKLELIDTAGVNIPVNTNAISTASAALTVVGGVGIGQDLRVGGTIYAPTIIGTANSATNIANGAAWSIPIQISPGQTGFVGITTQTGYVLSTDGTSATWQALAGIPVGISNSTTNVAITTTNVNSSYYIPFTPNNNGYNRLYVDSNIVYNPNTDVITFGGTTDSTTSTDGTVIVSGGLGVAKNIVIGANSTVYGTQQVLNNTQATNTASGALQVVGGVGVGADLYATRVFDGGNRVVTQVNPTAGTAIGISNITNVGTATSFTINNFGVTALQGSTYIGVSASTGSVTIQNFGVQTLTAGTDTAVSASTGTVTVWDTSNLQSVTQRGATTPYGVTITSATNATNTASGALQIPYGGAGIGQNLWVGGTINRAGNISATGWNTNGIALSVPTATYTETNLTGAQTTTAINSLGTPIIAQSAGSPVYANAATLFIGGAPVADTGVTITNPWALLVDTGKVKVADATSATTTSTGALQVAGGIGVGSNIVAGGYITAGTAVSGSPVVGFSSNNLTIASYTSAAMGSASTSTVQNLDVWSTSTYRSARYSIELVDTGFTPHRIHYTEIVLIHDGAANVYKSEYGVITNVGELGTFDATVTGNGIQLTFQPTWPSLSAPAALVVKAVRTSIN